MVGEEEVKIGRILDSNLINMTKQIFEIMETQVHFNTIWVYTFLDYFHQLGPLGRVGLVVDMSMCCVLCVVCLSVPFPCNFF